MGLGGGFGPGGGGGPGMGFGMGRMSRPPLTEEENKNKPKITRGMIKRIGKYLKPYWLQFVAVFAAISVSSALGLVPSLLTKQIVDTALPGRDLNLLVMLIGLSFGATITLNLIGVLESYLNTWISQHIIFDMKNQMYAHMQGMSHRFFTNERQGEIITRMTSDIGGVQGVVSGTLTSVINNVLTITATLIALFSLSWQLALLGVVVVPLFILPTKRVGRTRWKILTQAQQKNDEMNQILNETLSVSGSMLSKLFTREKREYGKFTEINSDSTKLNIKEQMAGRWFRMSIGSFTAIGPMLLYLVGGILIVKGNEAITIGTIIAAVTLLGRLYMPVSALLNVQVDITRSMALFQRIFDYFDKEHEIRSKPGAVAADSLKGDIVFRDVFFDYDPNHKILKEISFTIPEDSLVALVGPSGSGKSTVTYLIPRLYDVTAGSVMINGTDVRDYDLESLRKGIGMVTQDTYLFNGTVRENLLYANENASQDDIEAACKAANIHDFIVSLPDGYDTLVGNRGVKLSGGEKQRVSIARVILKNPDVIILDEATSSLDSISESSIQYAIEPLLKGRTSLVIAHRLSTIMAADLILVIKDGRIVERGRHDDLLKNNGVYRELYETQFKIQRKNRE